MNRSNLISGLLGFVLGIGALLVFNSGALPGTGPMDGGNTGSSASGGSSGDSGFSGERPAKSGSRPGAITTSSDRVVEDLRESFLVSNARSRRIKTAEYFAEMTPENALEMRELFLEFDKQGMRFDQEWGLLWHQWGKVDPKSALQQVLAEKDGAYPGFVTQITGIIFSSWAEENPLAARLFLEQIEDDKQFNAAFNGIVRGMNLVEAAAIAEATEFGHPRLASMAAETIADRTLREAGNTTALEEWYSSIRNEELRQGALHHVYGRLRKRDLDTAAGWVRERAAEGVDTSVLIPQVAAEFARKRSIDGLDWYLSLPEGARNKPEFNLLLSAAQAQGDAFTEWSTANQERLETAKRELQDE